MLKQKNKSQFLATISLAVMAIGFFATMPVRNSLWGLILQGGFEAGLIGGLADWFAVTALFRHPLGLPIPHTALLPKNRKRIIAGIISMLENNWLTKESIRKKMDSIHFSKKLFSILEQEIHSLAIRTNIIRLIQHLIHSVDIKKIALLIAKELKWQLNHLDTKNYLPIIVDQVIERKYDEKSLDYILKEINEWAQKDSTKFKLGRMAVDVLENIKADAFLQFALKSFSNLVNEEKLGNIIQKLILKGVDSFRDPFNQNRQTLMSHIHQKLQSVKEDEKIYEELNHLKNHWIEKWDSEHQIGSFLVQLQQKASNLVENPGFFDHYILPLIIEMLDKIKADPEKVNALESWIKQHIFSFVNNNHPKIGKLVKENLDKLDDQTLINMVETNVGKDLQWIRVNGAVCGFLIGLILVVIKVLI